MAEMQRIIKDYGFSDLAARLIKLLNLAAFSSEDRVALAAFEAADVLCDFGSGTAPNAWMQWLRSGRPASLVNVQ